MDKTNGERLGENRKLANMTQKQLAEAVGITDVYLSLLENDKRNASRKLRRRIDRVLRKKLNDPKLETFEQ